MAALATKIKKNFLSLSIAKALQLLIGPGVKPWLPVHQYKRARIFKV